MAMASLLVAGCASMPGLSDEDTVKRYSQARQQALKEGMFEKAYEYMAPGYRATNDIKRFKLDYAGASRLKSSKIKSVTCEPDVCSISVVIEYEAAVSPRATTLGAKPMLVERVSEERWVKVDNKWWFARSD
ncbi:MAG: hypothetical protein LPK85_06405 [Gammaproteobacteria bacterium]|nr:hypothetical protein [Gammaproteobacteria bacterium]